MAAQAQVPVAAQPVVLKDPSGNMAFSRPWYLFFQTVGAFVTGSSNAPIAIPVGASPFSYTVAGNGLVVVQGGAVTAIEYGRGGVFTTLGITQGPIPSLRGDVVRVTHAGAPAMTLINQ